MNAQCESLASGKGSRLYGTLFVGGVLFLLGFYAFRHPLTFGDGMSPDLAMAIGRGGLATIGMFGFIQVLHLLGLGILSLLGTLEVPPIRADQEDETGRLSPFIGLVWLLLAVPVLLAGGILNPVSAVLLLVPILGALRNRTMTKAGWFPRMPPRIIFLCLILAGVLWNTMALAPSTAYDDHVYHLDMIQTFAGQGSLWVASDQPNSFRPGLHAAFMAWFRILVPQPWHTLANVWLLFMLAYLLIIGFAQNSPFPMLVFFSTPLLVRLAVSHYAEPVLLLILALLVIPATRPFPMLRGLVAAMLPGVKYSGLVLMPMGIVWWWFDSPESEKRAWPRFLAGCLVGGLCTFAPFLLRNAWGTGYPFYPHLFAVDSTRYQISRGRIMNMFPPSPLEFPESAYNGTLLLERFGPGRDPVQLLASPWNLTMNSFFHTPSVSLQAFDGQIGVMPLTILLLLAYILAMQRKLPPELRSLLGLLLGYHAFWLWGSHMARFALPTTLLLAIISGPLYARCPGKMRSFLLVAGLLGMLWTVRETQLRLVMAAPVVSGRISTDVFLGDRLPFYGAFTFINAQLPPASRLLVLLEERTFLLQRPHIWTGQLPVWFAHLLLRVGTVDGLRALFSREGITHVLMPRFGLQFFPRLISSASYQQLFVRLIKDEWKIVFEDRNMLVYSAFPPSDP